MKRTVTLLLLVCALSASAQSTCETRVDAHQKATTKERVNYCLQPGYESADTHGPQLIYSSLGYYNPSTQTPKPQRVTAHQGTFDDADIEVTRSFVQTRQFPKFTDGRVSEQYKREYQEALLSGPEIAREAVSLTECEPQEDVVSAAVQKSTSRQKSRAQKSSRRRVSKKRAVQTKSVSPVELPLDTVEEIVSTADSYTYEESSYAPATPADVAASKVSATQGIAAAPAGIADEPAEEGQDIDSSAYSYAPAVPANETEIPAGEYSYAPATK